MILEKVIYGALVVYTRAAVVYPPPVVYRGDALRAYRLATFLLTKTIELY